MQEADNNKYGLDDFSQLFKDKLKDYRLPPEDTDWQKMEELLAPPGRTPRQYLLIGLGMAAAVAILFILFTPLVGPLPQETELSAFSIEMYEEKVIKEEEAASIEKPIPSVTTARPAMITKYTPTNQQVSIASTDSLQDIHQIKEEIAGETREKAEEKAHSKQEDQQPATEKQVEQANTFYPDNYNNLYVAISKKRKKWQLSTGVATGSNLQLGNLSGSDYATSPGGDMNTENPDPDEEDNQTLMTRSYEEIGKELLPVDDYSSVRYSVPLSVGFTIKKELNEHIAIETGLVYTYLSTDLIYTRSNIRKASKLSLHYLGIPVNLVVNLWEQNNWNIYLSGGFMAEKGIRAILKHKEQTSDAVTNTTIRTGINGMQWSLQVSPGVSYAISRQWSLYAEPRISYFMDNNQPISSRTDSQWTIGIGGGLRYNF